MEKYDKTSLKISNLEYGFYQDADPYTIFLRGHLLPDEHKDLKLKFNLIKNVLKILIFFESQVTVINVVLSLRFLEYFIRYSSRSFMKIRLFICIETFFHTLDQKIN